MKIMKACFSVVVALILSASVVNASQFSACAKEMLDEKYQVTMPTMNAVAGILQDCGYLLDQELLDVGVPPEDVDKAKIAVAAIAVADWGLRNLDTALNYLELVMSSEPACDSEEVRDSVQIRM